MPGWGRRAKTRWVLDVAGLMVLLLGAGCCGDKNMVCAPAAGEVSNVNMQVCIDPEKRVLVATYSADIPIGGAVDGRLSFLLNPGMRVDSVTLKSGRKCLAVSKTASIAPGLEVLHVALTLTRDTLDRRDQLIIRYSGKLSDCSKVTRYVKDQITPEFSLIRPDSFAYPLFAEPNYDSLCRYITSARFSYDLEVTCPGEANVVAFGERIRSSQDGSRQTVCYRSTVPTYRIVFACGRYVTKKSRRQRDAVQYVLNGEAGDETDLVLEQAVGASDFYRKQLGAPVQEPRIVIMDVPAGYSSSVSPDGILLAQDQGTQAASRKFLFHEIAHSWAPLDAPKFLSEGFAEFMAVQAVAELESPTNADDLMKALQGAAERLSRENPAAHSLRPDDDSAGYVCGPVFMKELCDAIGCHQLGDIMKRYAALGRPLTVEQFAALAEQVSAQDISGVLAAWK